MRYRFAKRFYVVTVYYVYAAVSQRIFCCLSALYAFGLITANTIRERPFALATAPLAVHHSIALQSGKCRRKVGTNGIAALASACNDIYDVCYVVTITHTWIVYVVDFCDVLRIESQHLHLAHYDTIDSELNFSPIVDSRNRVVDVVNTQIGKR